MVISHDRHGQPPMITKMEGLCPEGGKKGGRQSSGFHEFNVSVGWDLQEAEGYQVGGL